MRRIRCVLLLTAAGLSLAAPKVSAQWGPDITGPDRLWQRAEISLTLGYGRSLAHWTTLHLSELSTSLTPRVSAQNRIEMKTRGSLVSGAAATFYFRSGIALQGGFGYLKNEVTADTRFTFRQTRGEGSSQSWEFAGTGELTTVPVFVNFVNSFELFRGAFRRGVRSYFYFGPALFLNSLLVDAFAGAAAVVPSSGAGGAADEAAEALKVPVAIEDRSWVSVGADVGIGVDFQFARALALTLEGKFFYAPKKNLGWRWKSGLLPGLTGAAAQVEFTEARAAEYMNETTSLTIRPSFFHFSGGIKFVF